MRHYDNSESAGSEEIIEIKRQPRCLERNVCGFIKSRRGVHTIAWSTTVAIITLLAVLIAPESDAAEQAVCIISSLLISVSVTISILARYAWLDHFPVSAFLNIGVTFVLSFFQIGLAATDIAFTKKSRARNNTEAFQSLQGLMRVLWYLVYCGTIISGSVLMQFFKLYWTSGRFSMKSNIKFVLKSLLKKILIVIIILGATGVGLFFLLKDDDEK